MSACLFDGSGPRSAFFRPTLFFVLGLIGYGGGLGGLTGRSDGDPRSFFQMWHFSFGFSMYALDSREKCDTEIAIFLFNDVH